MKIIITRHGETNENKKKIAQGQSIGGTLSKKGIDQAKKLAQRLKEEKIDFIYVSDLKRAVHTAKEILQFHPSAKMIITKGLRERNLGIYEGKLSAGWRNAVKKSTLPFHAHKPTGGESYIELQNRVTTFFNQLMRKHKNDTLLIISHGGATTMLLLKIFDKPITRKNYEKYHPDNTAITILDTSIKKPHKVHFLNNVDHL